MNLAETKIDGTQQKSKIKTDYSILYGDYAITHEQSCIIVYL